jgi:hypothetical protein
MMKDSKPMLDLDMLRELLAQAELYPNSTIQSGLLERLERQWQDIRTGEQLALVLVAILIELAGLSYVRQNPDAPGSAYRLLVFLVLLIPQDVMEQMKTLDILERLMQLSRVTMTSGHTSAYRSL